MALQPLYTYIWLYIPDSTAPTTSFGVTRKRFNIKTPLPYHPDVKKNNFPLTVRGGRRNSQNYQRASYKLLSR